MILWTADQRPMRIVVFRILNAGLSLLASFAVLAAVLRRFEGDISTALLVSVSFMPFVPLLQLGLGRPLYTWIRLGRGGISHLFPHELQRLRNFFALQMCAAAAAGSASFIFAGVNSGLEIAAEWVYVGILAGLIYLSGAGVLLRDVYYAADCELDFERLEALRRTALLLAALLLSIGAPILYALAVLSVPAVVSFSSLRFLPQFGVALRTSDSASRTRTFGSLAAASAAYFCFQLLDIMFYNIPLYFILGQGSQSDLTSFNLWSRFFLICCLVPRLWLDATLNGRVSLIAVKGYSEAVRSLRRSSCLCAAVACISSISLGLIAPQLARWLGAEVSLSIPFLFSIVVWSTANAFVHACGTFLVSVPGGPRVAAALSLGQLILGGSAFALSYSWIGLGFDSSICVAGASYAVIAAASVCVTSRRLTEKIER